MTWSTLLLRLQWGGVLLRRDGDGLVVDAPRGFLTPALFAALGTHKADLLAILDEAPLEPNEVAERAAKRWEAGLTGPLVAEVLAEYDRLTTPAAFRGQKR